MTAFDSLTGLSVGDAFGAQFFVMANRPLFLDETAIPPAPWPWTDDTEMACDLLDVLHPRGQVDRDALAERHDPYRGYGPGAVVLLRALREGELGNGARVLAHDTVPFCVWAAARHLTDSERAVRTCVAVGGDIDTTAAITGIVAAHTGADGIPPAWRDAREPLPGWLSPANRDGRPVPP
jgi:ADP-ribosylglycohydrolase